jgi:bacterioferritin
MFNQQISAPNPFLADIACLRENARALMANPPSRNPVRTAIALLQTVLTAEIACVMRYTMISVSPDGLRNEWIGAEFQEQANDERRHMALAAARIEQLGGTPDFTPTNLHTNAPLAPGEFAVRVRENLAAERAVIEHYHELIAFLAPHDPATCAILTDITRDEEDHTSDMEDLLVSYTH